MHGCVSPCPPPSAAGACLRSVRCLRSGEQRHAFASKDSNSRIVRHTAASADLDRVSMQSACSPLASWTCHRDRKGRGACARCLIVACSFAVGHEARHLARNMYTSMCRVLLCTIASYQSAWPEAVSVGQRRRRQETMAGQQGRDYSPPRVSKG